MEQEENKKEITSNKELINTLKEQNEILKKQWQKQERISNNVLFFFWVFIILLIPLFIFPILSLLYGVSFFF